MELLETFHWLMGKPVVPSALGERIASGCGLVLMAIGFWAVVVLAQTPAPPRPPVPWWVGRIGDLFILYLAISIAHKVLIIKGTFISPLGLAGVLIFMVIFVSQPLAMARAGLTFTSLPSPYGWIATGGLVVGSVWIDIFTWMYERMRQGETGMLSG